MNTKDFEFFKKKLEKEKTVLETELKSIGHKDPKIAGGWQTGPSKMETDNADENEVADKLEDYEENISILGQLDTQLAQVSAALAKINNGSYGDCEICKKPIERERLSANPSARTCVEHLTDK
jgi:RNA polymerase-binding transcription factor DksA